MASVVPLMSSVCRSMMVDFQVNASRAYMHGGDKMGSVVRLVVSLVLSVKLTRRKSDVLFNT